MLRKPSHEFNLFQALVNFEEVTTIRGDGLLSHAGSVAVQGGNLVVASSKEGYTTSKGLALGGDKDQLIQANVSRVVD